MRPGWLYLLVAAAIACATGPITLRGQQVSFEAATIEAAKNPAVTAGWSQTPTRLTAVGTLKTSIRQAYGVEDVQISGGPKWIDQDMFEISAKTAAPASVPEQRLMLQTLLSDRFRLATHTESRQLPVYSLVVSKSGPRLQPANGAGGTSSGPTMLRGTMDTATLARNLTSTLRRPVIDNTQLKGSYKVSLTWGPDDQMTGPSIFTAIQEQLGLKLESTKGPVLVHVIDRAEKPSAN